MPAVLKAKVEQSNYPTYITRYQDPATKLHKIVVVMVLPGDVEDYNIFVPETDAKKGCPNKVYLSLASSFDKWRGIIFQTHQERHNRKVSSKDFSD